MMFDERRAAQMAAYFLDKAGGKMPLLKLMKLMYLADRESLRQYGYPITFDAINSMDHGPVLSRSYDLAKGAVESNVEGWDHWISDRENHDVSLNRACNRDALLDLSDVEVAVLATVWRNFGHMTKWQIRDYTHTLPEWRDPEGSSLPIAFENVLLAVGYGPNIAAEMALELGDIGQIDRRLTRA